MNGAVGAAVQQEYCVSMIDLVIFLINSQIIIPERALRAGSCFPRS
jgi:hypothetical protein